MDNISDNNFNEKKTDVKAFELITTEESLDIKSMYFTELSDWMKEKGQPAFRAKQAFEWLHQKYVGSVDEMMNLPKNLREMMRDSFCTIEEETRLESKKDGTIKFLYKLADGQMIETVFMKYSYGNSICISSQAGCRMGCRFCASTIGGLYRNLKASEMLEQVYATMRATGERISNIVVMGTGEPLDNYDNLIRFVKLISDEKGYNISQRNITVSSCGIVPKIRKLAEEELTITFALSLHATTDEERKALMPIANIYTLEETIDACRYYFDKTGRRVTFEYSMVKGVNDSTAHADRLAKLLRGINCHVNLIPINKVDERDYERSDDDSIEKFKLLLEKKSINGTIRRSVGSDIDAACGQLRRKYNK